MILYGLAFALGVACGLRSLMGPTAVSWAAALGLLDLRGSWLAFLGHRWIPWILSALQIGELIGDKLPWTPSRTVAPAFAARVLSGALTGAAVGVAAGSMIAGALAGAAGAILGTLGGRALRARLAAAFGRDLPAALLEDGLALAIAAACVFAMRGISPQV